jgi:hypothetical protein
MADFYRHLRAGGESAAVILMIGHPALALVRWLLGLVLGPVLGSAAGKP